MKLVKKIISLFKQTYEEWQDDKVSRLAAALAYYTIFSLAPLLLIAITVAGLLWSRSTVESQIIGQMQGLLGTDGADFIRNLLQNASINMNKGIWATIVGVFVLIFGSIGVFRELRNALNTMWGIETPEIKGLWKNIKHLLINNLLSFTMVLGVGFILLVSLLLSTALTAFNGVVNSYFHLPQFLTGLLNTVFTLAIITLVFALLFKYLPETEMAWGDVFLGGFVTALLFLLGKVAIGIYLGNSSVGTTFGAAGSLALLLIWVYYSAQILYFGAEFTQVYANRYGSKIGQAPPDKQLLKQLHAPKKLSLAPEQSLITAGISNLAIARALPDFPRNYSGGAAGLANYDRDHAREQEAKTTAYVVAGLVTLSFVSGFLTKIGLGRKN